jgi:hypothetical protein
LKLVSLLWRQRHELPSQLNSGMWVEQQPGLASLAVRTEHPAADELAKRAVCATDLSTDVSGRPQHQRGTEERALAASPRSFVDLTECHVQWPPHTCELVLGSSSCKH